MKKFYQFSVIIPLYNKRAWIKRAIESVLSQKLDNFELIVIDDGSTDNGVEEIISIFNNEKFRLIKQLNKGAWAARNAGIENARSNWIAFLDADDIWFNDHLLELNEIIKKFPQSGLISTKYIMVHNNIKELKYKRVEKANIKKIDYFSEASNDIGIVFSSSSAVRRDVAFKLGGFKPFRAGEDLEYWARIALIYPVAVSNKITSVYYRGTGGIMETIELEQPINKFIKLSDVSPSVKMICEKEEQGILLFNKPNIREYVNSRLLSGTLSEIYKGNYSGARLAFEIALKPINFKYHLYKLLLSSPDVILSLIVKIYKLIKKFKLYFINKKHPNS